MARIFDTIFLVHQVEQVQRFMTRSKRARRLGILGGTQLSALACLLFLPTVFGSDDSLFTLLPLLFMPLGLVATGMALHADSEVRFIEALKAQQWDHQEQRAQSTRSENEVLAKQINELEDDDVRK